ncbi:MULTISPECIES: zinc-binding dehydrogenase [unclassified Streptomyces]|uniref:quinone oxidoreductase family protein n=1 Tax=unclassified Streptomyces TaxID=2593676 RepID=UPI00081B66A5|nr:MULTISPECIES: zinc-binding dehydrogenase [unclassified Streptomyces]MYX74174.1 zinc-binding dehydrogenase [Streptomyces sp. SID3915]SCD53418.1 NADPH:quinone reductase [Streptomyces sp. BpilaLS-43]
MPATMTALFGGTGPDWEAREIPVPRPGPGQVLVRARAVAVNNADPVMLAAADPTAGGTGREYRAGYECAGEVAAVGDGVRSVAVGARVMGTSPASFAQYVVADHRHVLPVPDELGYEEACALPTGLLTEHGALMAGGYEPGQAVLITAATSGIGLIGVQIARALGAGRIVATTRNAAKAPLLERAGADTVVVTSEQDLTRAVLDATGGQGADVVLDHVGGRTFAACLPATRVDGAVVNIGRLDTASSTIDLDALSYRHLRVRGVSFGFTRPAELGAVIAAAGEQLLPAVADGRIRPLVDSTYSFATAAEAGQRLRSHRPHGKIILTVP